MSRTAVGVGCRRGSSAEAIARVVRETLAGFDLPAGAVPLGLFTTDLKRGEAGLRAAAEALGLPLAFLPAADLDRQLGQVLTRSARVSDAVGVPSVAEAAALAGAGAGARLLGPRVAREGVTCAVAVSGDGA